MQELQREEIVFACPPSSLSCLVGNLFGELDTPCDVVKGETGLVICGTTFSGNKAVLTIHDEYCCFSGLRSDLDAVRNGVCVERRCKNG